MKRLLVMLVLTVGCATTAPTKPTPPSVLPKYQNGDCLMLVDPLTGKKPTRHRVRVEKVDTKLKRYWYRWLLDSNKWDSELSTTVGDFLVLEKITEKVDDCPKD